MTCSHWIILLFRLNLSFSHSNEKPVALFRVTEVLTGPLKIFTSLPRDSISWKIEFSNINKLIYFDLQPSRCVDAQENLCKRQNQGSQFHLNLVT